MGRLFVLFFPGQFIKDLFSLHKKTLSLVRVQIASTGMYLVWKRIVWTTVHLCLKQCKPLFKNCWSLFLTILLLLTQIWRWGRWERGGDRSAPHCSHASASGPWPCAKNYYRHNPRRFKIGLVQFSLVGNELLAQSKKNGFKVCFVHLTYLIRMAKEGMWEMMQRTKIIQRIKLRKIIECYPEYTQSENLWYSEPGYDHWFGW